MHIIDTGNENKHDISDLAVDIANVIDALHSHHFSVALARLLNKICVADEFTILVFEPGKVPVPIYPHINLEEEDAFNNYLNTWHKNDMTLHSTILDERKVACIRDVISNLSDFKKSDFYQQYYRQLGYSDEVIIKLSLNDDCYMVLFLGRDAMASPILTHEIASIETLLPIIESLAKQYWIENARSSSQVAPFSLQLESALQHFGAGVLTEREQEVSGLLLKGMCSKSIARQLDISIDTVKVHRKNIHDRLGTSNQSDLFLHFINELKSKVVVYSH